MVLKDSLVHAWLGAGAAEFLHHPLPAALGIIVGALGWWFAQGQRHRRKIPEKL